MPFPHSTCMIFHHLADIRAAHLMLYLLPTWMVLPTWYPHIAASQCPQHQSWVHTATQWIKPGPSPAWPSQKEPHYCQADKFPKHYHCAGACTCPAEVERMHGRSGIYWDNISATSLSFLSPFHQPILSLSLWSCHQTWALKSPVQLISFFFFFLCF